MAPAYVDPLSASALRLDVFDINGGYISTATGFCAVASDGQNFLVTARHVVRNRHNVSDLFLERDVVPSFLRIRHRLDTPDPEDIDWGVAEEIVCKDGQARWIEHPELHGDVDVVAIPLTQTEGVRVEPIDLNAGQPALYHGPGAWVSVIGFPVPTDVTGGLALWIGGTVASEPSTDAEGRPMFFVSAPTKGGLSGSPVFVVHRPPGTITLAEGTTKHLGQLPETRFLGVYTGRYDNDEDLRLGRVWKRSAVRRIVEHGVEPKMP